MQQIPDKIIYETLASLMMLGTHSLIPTQTKVCERLVGYYLHYLGIPEYRYEYKTFYAIEPEKQID